MPNSNNEQYLDIPRTNRDLSADYSQVEISTKTFTKFSFPPHDVTKRLVTDHQQKDALSLSNHALFSSIDRRILSDPNLNSTSKTNATHENDGNSDTLIPSLSTRESADAMLNHLFRTQPEDENPVTSSFGEGDDDGLKNVTPGEDGNLDVLNPSLSTRENVDSMLKHIFSKLPKDEEPVTSSFGDDDDDGLKNVTPGEDGNLDILNPSLSTRKSVDSMLKHMFSKPPKDEKPVTSSFEADDGDKIGFFTGNDDHGDDESVAKITMDDEDRSSTTDEDALEITVDATGDSSATSDDNVIGTPGIGTTKDPDGTPGKNVKNSIVDDKSNISADAKVKDSNIIGSSISLESGMYRMQNLTKNQLEKSKMSEHYIDYSHFENDASIPQPMYDDYDIDWHSVVARSILEGYGGYDDTYADNTSKLTHSLTRNSYVDDYSNVDYSNIKNSTVKGFSKVGNSSMDSSGVKNSTIKDSSLGHSTVNDSKMNASKSENSVIKESSNVDDSAVKKSIIGDSKLIDSKINDSNVKQSKLDVSKLNDSTIKGSDIENSDVQSSNISGANIELFEEVPETSESNVRSSIKNFEIEQSKVKNSDVQQSQVRNSDVKNSNVNESSDVTDSNAKHSEVIVEVASEGVSGEDLSRQEMNEPRREQKAYTREKLSDSLPEEQTDRPRKGVVADYPREVVDDYPREEDERFPSQKVKQFPRQEVEQFSSQKVNQFPRQEVEQFPSQKVKQFSRQEVEQFPSQKVKQFPRQEVEQFPSQKVKQFPQQEVEQFPSQKVKQFPRQEVERIQESEKLRESEPEGERVQEPEVIRDREPEFERVPEPQFERVPEPQIERIPEPQFERAAANIARYDNEHSGMHSMVNKEPKASFMRENATSLNSDLVDSGEGMDADPKYSKELNAKNKVAALNDNRQSKMHSLPSKDSDSKMNYSQLPNSNVKAMHASHHFDMHSPVNEIELLKEIDIDKYLPEMEPDDEEDSEVNLDSLNIDALEAEAHQQKSLRDEDTMTDHDKKIGPEFGSKDMYIPEEDKKRARRPLDNVSLEDPDKPDHKQALGRPGLSNKADISTSDMAKQAAEQASRIANQENQGQGVMQNMKDIMPDPGQDPAKQYAGGGRISSGGRGKPQDPMWKHDDELLKMAFAEI